MRIASSLSVGLAAAVISASAARGSSVYVQYATPALGNVVVTDPLHATATEPGIFGDADLVTGSFEGHAVHDGSSSIASVAYTGILQLSITNAGGSPLVFGGAGHPLYADITASPSGTFGESGSAASQLNAILQVNDPGGTRIASVAYTAVQAWSGGSPVAPTFDATPSASGGASASISVASANALAARLSMPDITLSPGESITIYFNLLPVAIAGGEGFTATTDATAQLHLFLPEGAVFTTDAGVETILTWITVPEPSFAALAGFALAACAALRSRAGTSPRL